MCHVVLIVDRERLAPVALAREYGVAQAVVDKAFAQPAALDLGEHVFDSLLYIHAVEHVGVDESSRLGVVRLLLDIAALDHRHDLQTEVAREGVVARVVRRHGHNGAGTVSCQYIVRDIDRDAAAGKGVYGIRTRSHAAHAPRLGDTLALRAQLRLGDVLLDVCAGGIGRQLADPLVLGCDDHERHAVDRIGTRREYLQLTLRALYIEEYLRTDRAADPVALYLFQRVAPFERIQAVEHALCVCRHAQLPLLHSLLHHGITAAHRQSVLNLVVGQHRAQRLAPVDLRVGTERQTPVLQRLLPLALIHSRPLGRRERECRRLRRIEPLGAVRLQMRNELPDRLGTLHRVVVVVAEHLGKGPLRPAVVLGIARAHLAAPVEAETDLVELLAVAGYVLLGGQGGVLAGLYGILLGRQAECVVAHRVQHVEARLSFVTRIDV